MWVGHFQLGEMGHLAVSIDISPLSHVLKGEKVAKAKGGKRGQALKLENGWGVGSRAFRMHSTC
jgi:hypothetical protein